MKKMMLCCSAILLMSALAGCIGKEKEDTSNGIDDDGTGRIPARVELVGSWQSNEYKGWEPRLDQDVYIARGLTLNDDGTYENKYRGKLTQVKEGYQSKTEYGEWEEEEGTWEYNPSSGEITYHPSSDKLVRYETAVLYDTIKNAYSEKCLIKESGEYKGDWITLDSYLKRVGNKQDLRYVVKKQ